MRNMAREMYIDEQNLHVSFQMQSMLQFSCSLIQMKFKNFIDLGSNFKKIKLHQDISE
jgi:hypothetical protein